MDAAHVALRTVRRFLERHVDTFEVVVMAVTGDDFAAFSQVRRALTLTLTLTLTL